MKWNFIWLSRVQRTLFKGTANEGKDQIKWNEMYKASNRTGQQHGNIRVPKLSDRKQYHQALKAVDAGKLGNAWKEILLPDKQSFAA